MSLVPQVRTVVSNKVLEAIRLIYAHKGNNTEIVPLNVCDATDLDNYPDRHNFILNGVCSSSSDQCESMKAQVYCWTDGTAVWMRGKIIALGEKYLFVFESYPDNNLKIWPCDPRTHRPYDRADTIDEQGALFAAELDILVGSSKHIKVWCRNGNRFETRLRNCNSQMLIVGMDGVTSHYTRDDVLAIWIMPNE